MDEFRRRRDLAIGPDRPAAIVEVEVGNDVGQVDIGGPIGVDRSDIAPIGLGFLARRHAGLREVMRHRFAVLDEVGNDVLAEIMARIRIGGIALEKIDQERRLEDIDAHAASATSGLPGMCGGFLGFSRKAMMLFFSSICMTPKRRRFLKRRLETADGHVGSRIRRAAAASSRSPSCRCDRRRAAR